MPSLSASAAKAVARLKEEYADAKDFLEKNNPSQQRIICKEPNTCFFGNSPTLTLINTAFGPKTAQLWLAAQITSAVAFSGVGSVPDEDQYLDLVAIMEERWYYLKIDELQLFFWRFKGSRYEHFYTTFEPHIILRSLETFCRERVLAYERHEQALRDIENERSRRESITYEEYKRRNSNFLTKTNTK